MDAPHPALSNRSGIGPTTVMAKIPFEDWRRWAIAVGWPRLALILSGLWVTLVVLAGLASSDPGENHLARLIALPIVALSCLAYAFDWVSTRAVRVDAPPPSEPGAESNPVPIAPSLREQQ